MRKKFLVTLAIIVVLGLSGCSKYPFEYVVENDSITITKVKDDEVETIVIPETIKGLPVTRIDHRAFSGCESLTSIKIPDSVTSIGYQAFSGCESLTSIKIPDSVTSIDYFAFNGCKSLTNIKIPNSVTNYIGGFSGCTNLTSIELPDSMSCVDFEMFKECIGLTSIKIPDSVTSIDCYAFWGCENLQSIKIPDNVTSIGDWAFAKCTSLTSIEIPNSVTSIGMSTFSECENLTSIKIPSSVTSIDSNFSRNKVVVFVEPGSYAETWALDKRYSIEYYTSESAEKTEEDAVQESVKTLSERVGEKLYIGDEFTLGTYEQDNNLENGKEDIEWIVYKKKDDDKYLCVSKYVLDSQIFAKRDNEKPFWIYNDWNESYLKEWLNDSFYNEAFSENDKISIAKMETSYPTFESVEALENTRKLEGLKALKIRNKYTYDMVRVLNYEELDAFPGCVKVTEYAKAQGAWHIDDGTREHENCSDNWCIMSYDKSLIKQQISHYIERAEEDGYYLLNYDIKRYLADEFATHRHEECYYSGYSANGKESYYDGRLYDGETGVRPVICIDLSK